MHASWHFSTNERRARVVLMNLRWLYCQSWLAVWPVNTWLLPLAIEGSETFSYGTLKRLNNFDSFDYLINSENMCFLGLALPVFESWKENIQIIRKIKNIDSIYHLIKCDTLSFLFVLPYLSLDAERKIIKEIKNIESFDYLINFET